MAVATRWRIPYSVTKPFAAACVLLWSTADSSVSMTTSARTGQSSQTETTVRECLSHQSGLVALDDPAPTEVFYDWDPICALLARQEPSWEPGTSLGESALFYGHPLGQIVRRGRRPHARRRSCATRSVRRTGSTSTSGSTPASIDRVAELTGFEIFGPAFSEGHPPLVRSRDPQSARRAARPTSSTVPRGAAPKCLRSTASARRERSPASTSRCPAAGSCRRRCSPRPPRSWPAATTR